MSEDTCVTCLGKRLLFSHLTGTVQHCPDCRITGDLALPEYVKCIPIGFPTLETTPWCGRPGPTFFISLEHAAIHALTGGRLVACNDCLRAIKATFEANGSSFGPDLSSDTEDENRSGDDDEELGQ